MKDGAEGSLTFEYTNTGRVSRVTDMEGAVTDYEYDALGRLVRVSGALGSGAAFTYDGTGRMTSRTDANGNTTRYAYSPAGNLLSVTDGEPLEVVNKIAKTIENKGFPRKGKADGKNFVRWKPLHILERCKEKRQGKAAVRHGLGIVFKL